MFSRLFFAHGMTLRATFVPVIFNVSPECSEPGMVRTNRKSGARGDDDLGAAAHTFEDPGAIAGLPILLFGRTIVLVADLLKISPVFFAIKVSDVVSAQQGET